MEGPVLAARPGTCSDAHHADADAQPGTGYRRCRRTARPLAGRAAGGVRGRRRRPSAALSSPARHVRITGDRGHGRRTVPVLLPGRRMGRFLREWEAAARVHAGRRHRCQSATHPLLAAAQPGPTTARSCSIRGCRLACKWPRPAARPSRSPAGTHVRSARPLVAAVPSRQPGSAGHRRQNRSDQDHDCRIVTRHAASGASSAPAARHNSWRRRISSITRSASARRTAWAAFDIERRALNGTPVSCREHLRAPDAGAALFCGGAERHRGLRARWIRAHARLGRSRRPATLLLDERRGYRMPAVSPDGRGRRHYRSIRGVAGAGRRHPRNPGSRGDRSAQASRRRGRRTGVASPTPGRTFWTSTGERPMPAHPPNVCCNATARRYASSWSSDGRPDPS